MKRYDVEHTVWGDLSIVQRSNGEWVKWDDVRKLEESHKELLNVLREMVAVYSGQLQNDGNYTVIDTLARVAITNAEGTN